MKIIRYVFCFLALICFSSGIQAAQKIAELHTQMGYSTYATVVTYYLDILTPEGMEKGVYTQPSSMLSTGDLKLLSWSGPGTAPVMRVESVDDGNSCPGLSQYDSQIPTDWQCYDMKIGVYYDGDLHGCPWLVTTRIDSIIPKYSSFGPYMGPVANQSTCPAEPLGPYDVSWDENRVVRSTQLTLQSTGGVIERTLYTYLMKDNQLCDGGQMDDRGKYCRFVAQQITFTASGCDNAKVTVTSNRHSVFDKQLHDMVVHVDTSSMQPFDSTCRFTYVLNMI
ncbi:StfH/YfcO family fimbrial adhesin [Escherichia albertii]|uniref:StfH/YfcO family fimbrial adhesin n=1 Tax=Escherichia albertii TaxID=208962 RepID=UPI0002D70EDA|nr:StfH/YfcO family fimbrial adhesin [Escherichia albertii]